MTGFSLQDIYRPIRAHAPGWLANAIRSTGTAVLTPLFFSIRSGHARSSLARRAVSRRGTPLPWYTYPCIQFLAQRDCAQRTVLEFGAGQSTLWWAQRTAQVVAFEGNELGADWLQDLRRRVPANVALHAVPDGIRDPAACVAAIDAILALTPQRFDVVVIDGLCRTELIDVAARVVSDEGAIVCDNAEGYGFQQHFAERGFLRVDFFGYAPGVVRAHCTSIWFRPGTFLFDPHVPIPLHVEGL